MGRFFNLVTEMSGHPYRGGWVGEWTDSHGFAYKHGIYHGKPATAVIDWHIGGRDYRYEVFIVPGHVVPPSNNRYPWHDQQRGSEYQFLWYDSVSIEDQEDSDNYGDGFDEVANASDPQEAWEAAGGPRI